MFHIYSFFAFFLSIFFRYTMSHIASLFKEKGSDCWWELPLEMLLPAEVLEKVRPRFSLFREV